MTQRESSDRWRESISEADERPTNGGSLPLTVAIHRGILHCRKGEWHSGLHYLQVADGLDADMTLPGLYFSYLGLALARCQRRHEEATELCERGVAIQFYEPENFLNLAWVRLLARDRLGAITALERGLALDAKHAGLLDFQSKLGVRRAPVLRFLPRGHGINRFLGKMRYRLEAKQA
jgi:hypothetical protein